LPKPPKAIVIDEKLCKGCQICVAVCPKNVLAMSKEFNERGVHVPIIIDFEKCVSCILCELSCPDFAIHIEK